MKIRKFIPLLLSTLLFTGCAAGQSEIKNENETPNEIQSELSNEDQSETSNPPNTYRQLTMDEAVSMMEAESGYIILDVRRPDEFAVGHIPNAINVPNETIGTAEISELPNKNQLIFVYCRSGRRSKEAAEKLVNLGYTNIVEFGGILDWRGEIVTEN